jgi:hypothetical protein
MQQPYASMAKNIRFAEIAESFLTWNEGKTKIVQCVTMGSISHSETINKFRIKIKGLLTQINAMKIANTRTLV